MSNRQKAQRNGEIAYLARSPASCGHFGYRWTRNSRCAQCYPDFDAASQSLVRAIERDAKLIAWVASLNRRMLSVHDQALELIARSPGWTMHTAEVSLVYIASKYNMVRPLNDDWEDD